MITKGRQMKEKELRTLPRATGVSFSGSERLSFFENHGLQWVCVCVPVKACVCSSRVSRARVADCGWGVWSSLTWNNQNKWRARSKKASIKNVENVLERDKLWCSNGVWVEASFDASRPLFSKAPWCLKICPYETQLLTHGFPVQAKHLKIIPTWSSDFWGAIFLRAVPSYGRILNYYPFKNNFVGQFWNYPIGN